MSMDERGKQWASLYGTLSKSLALLGTENAFGEGDYWIVDDNYGDATHKLCVHRLSFLRPQLVDAVREALKPYPQWRVLVQMEIELNGTPIPSEGVIIYADHVEQHWDTAKFASLARALNL